MHPAIGLLIYVVIALHIVLPLGTWLLLSGRRDDTTRLWFISISIYSLSVCSIALRPLVSVYISYVLAWSGACASWLLMTETFRRELGLKPWRWPSIVLPVVAWSIFVLWLHEHSDMATTGVVVYSAGFICLNLVLSYLVWQLRRTFRSHSLLMIQAAFAVHAVVYFNRLYQYAASGNRAHLDVFSFTWVSNLVTLSTLLTTILICFGYWGFTLEKSNIEKQHAQQGQRQAQAESEAMRLLVKERDQLLMLNARVSSLSNLSSFSAMLVHDISQPLQALELGLYGLQSEIHQTTPSPSLQAHIDHLMVLSGKASEMVSSLRRLMVRGKDQVEAIEPISVIEAIFPVLQGEASQRHIDLSWTHHLPPGVRVQANAVMLQRLVFNLLANALDAFKAKPNDAPRIQISLQLRQKDQADWVVLQVQDNGPGLPNALLQQLTGPVESDKAQGSGLNLLLTQSMLRLWGGHTEMRNRPANDGPGAIIELWLAMASGSVGSAAAS